MSTKGDLTRALQRRFQLVDRGPCASQLSRELPDALPILLLAVDEVSEADRVRHEKGEREGEADSLQRNPARPGGWASGGLSSFGATSATGTGASVMLGVSATAGA